MGPDEQLAGFATRADTESHLAPLGVLQFEAAEWRAWSLMDSLVADWADVSSGI